MQELLLLLIFIGCGVGYDRVINYVEETCTCNFYYLTQYQSYLVIWNSTTDCPYTCIAVFRARNFDNVEATFRVCFRVLDYQFTSCETKIEFKDGLIADTGDKFDCKTGFPNIWCSKTSDDAQMKITTSYNDSSRLKLEVTATTDISLSHSVAMGIAYGCLGVLGIAVTVCFMCLVRKNQRKAFASGLTNVQDARNRLSRFSMASISPNEVDFFTYGYKAVK